MKSLTLTARGHAVAWFLTFTLISGIVYLTRDYCWNNDGIGWTKCSDLYAKYVSDAAAPIAP